MLAHRIRLAPTPGQCAYFARAAGTMRRVWNWALAESLHQIADQQHPNMMALKKRFNAIKYTHRDWLDNEGQPWLRTIHRDAHAQPFANLARAWSRYFKAMRESRPAYRRVFKKKGRCRDSFYVANDKLRLTGKVVVLPKVGQVVLREPLRWPGRIVSATVSREADHWFLAVLVDVPERVARLRRRGNGITGVDLGVSAAATLSNGEKIAGPRPLKAALRRLRIRDRRQSRKLKAAKDIARISGSIPKGVRLPVSANRTKGSLRLARLHARIARVRRDFLHKLTTRLCRENQMVVIEDLNVKGMLANARFARAIADVGFYEFRRQIAYKAQRYSNILALADRWYPSSKLCSSCGRRHGELGISERSWTCLHCNARHDRDVNAAVNLQRLATSALAAQSALPVASPATTLGTAVDIMLEVGGKVTLVRYEYGQQDGSGQEKNALALLRVFESIRSEER
ncbi:transposase [Massilia sp. Bi118]|uniref:RNA-guided endonuclease InsQ/TnpB family protein n=1 Tax=Massilia sp. Bi118 TaxID=2822346 RepID=UPI001E411ADC|nr:transposase [Massilia sp. Bi118]